MAAKRLSKSKLSAKTTAKEKTKPALKSGTVISAKAKPEPKLKPKPKPNPKPKAKKTGKPNTRAANRPLIPIDWDKVDSMCAIHCTGEEQAGILGIDYDTLQRACKREKKCTFAEYFGQKAASGKMSLRRKQYSIAVGGNPTMLIWLGKQWLGQAEKADPPEAEALPMTVTFKVKPAVANIPVTNAKP
jgi:hypothetical protein